MKTNLTISKALEVADQPIIIAGPCSAESEAQMLATAAAIKNNNSANIFRAGIWKPRTRPDAFEGVGSIGLKWMQRVKEQTGMLTATEVATAAHVEACLEAGIDILWIGARTTVNPFSVQEIANVLKGVDIPVFIKNPVSPDLSLWIGAMERLNRAGITKLAAIHRGFYSNSASTFRNDPKWELAIELKMLFPDLPMICDPSHICGNTEMIPYVAQKAMDLAMQGLMIETHCIPSVALSDSKQQLTPVQLKSLLQKIVVRSSSSNDSGFANKLETLRERINKTDDEMMCLLLNRMKVAEEIGLYKKENKVTILQTNRWESLLNERLSTAAVMGLSEDFVKALYVLIHEESIRKQTKVMNDNLTIN